MSWWHFVVIRIMPASTIWAKLICVVRILWFTELCRYLIHDGQQFTESQSEPPEGITVFKLEGQAMLQLWHQDAFSIRATCLVPDRRDGTLCVLQNELSYHVVTIVSPCVSHLYLSCCSFRASCSKAWKSTDRSATMELTASTPESRRRMSFLSWAQDWLWSAGAHRAILTRQGSSSLSSGSLRAARRTTSTFCMASKA